MNIVNFHSDFYYSNYELLYSDQAVRFLMYRCIIMILPHNVNQR